MQTRTADATDVEMKLSTEMTDGISSQQSVEPSVAAVVVTYNRKVLLAECLESLLAQSRRLNRVYVIDNASTDGTREFLDEKCLLSNALVEYFCLDENIGGAGGFFTGMKFAFEAGHDWIWVMDDDAEPLPTALERLMPWTTSPNVVGLCPIVGDSVRNVDFSHSDRGWTGSFRNGHIVKAIEADDVANKATVEISHCSFVGLMVSSKAIREIGLPKAVFFIHNDDTEFCTRLTKVGSILLVVNSMILHKVAANVGLNTSRVVLGRCIKRPKFERLWILYYGHRNLSWMIFGKSGNSGDKLRFILWHARLLIGAVVYDDHKFDRFRFWNAALLDGIRGNFDNQRPKQLIRPGP